jgi:hypothetical protein
MRRKQRREKLSLRNGQRNGEKRRETKSRCPGKQRAKRDPTEKRRSRSGFTVNVEIGKNPRVFGDPEYLCLI